MHCAAGCQGPLRRSCSRDAGISVFLAAERRNYLPGSMVGSSEALRLTWTNRFDASASGVSTTTYRVLLENKPGTAAGSTSGSIALAASTMLPLTLAQLEQSETVSAEGLDQRELVEALLPWSQPRFRRPRRRFWGGLSRVTRAAHGVMGRRQILSRGCR
jgi:hypothetical protein